MMRFVFLFTIIFNFIYASSSNIGTYYCNNSQAVKVNKDSLSTGKTTYKFKQNYTSEQYNNDIFMYKSLTAIFTNTKKSNTKFK